MISPVSLFGSLERGRQISTVLVRHGFGEILSRIGFNTGKEQEKPTDKSEQKTRSRVSFAERLRLTFQDLGPSFIKLGQIISTRPDLIPADVIEELKKLQDNVPPVSFDETAKTIENSLGSPLDELFVEFTPEPLASASIGQVHRAKLEVEGEIVEVVVKVQRPKIRTTIERDLELLYSFAKLIERFIPESRIYSPTGLVREFDRTITEELDFNAEADNAERFSRNFAQSVTIKFPKIFRERTSKKILTMEFFDGVKVTDAVREGVDGAYIAKTSLQMVAQMIFEDGFFHADPHPGNILVLKPLSTPIIGMIDLGLVGRLSDRTKDHAIDLMVAAVREDVDALTDALLSMGKPRTHVDKSALRSLVASLSQKYLGRPIKEIEVSSLIRDVIDGAMQFHIEMPSEMLMVGKAMMTIEGIGKEIYPDLDVYSELRPYFLKLIWKRYHPEKVAKELLRSVGQVNRMASDFPDQLHTILEDLRSGRLSLSAKDPNRLIAADRLGRRIFSGVLISAFTLSASILITQSEHETLGFVMLILAVSILFFHMMRDFFRQGKDHRP